MKKRILCLLLTCATCLSLTFSTAFSSEVTSTDCYIATTECPEEYLKYASENVSKYILSLDKGMTGSDIYVGTPFAFADNDSDVYYFPIVCGGSIQYLFRVYPDGNSFSAAITDFLSDDIESLAHQTSAETPMYLNRVDTKIIATIGTDSYELYEYPEYLSDGEGLTALASAEEYSIKNIKTPADIELALFQTRDVFEYINLNITETQGSQNWCTAFCLATIIRTKTAYPATAKRIMANALGVSNPSTSTPFPWVASNGAKIYEVCQGYGLYPIALTTTVSNSILIQEITAKRPVLQAITSKSGEHAVVLRGWSSSGIWSIWNPWFNFYENYSTTGTYVPTGYPSANYSYTPYMHAYNFG